MRIRSVIHIQTIAGRAGRSEARTALLQPVAAAEPDAQREAAVAAAEPDAQREAAVVVAEPGAQPEAEAVVVAELDAQPQAVDLQL